MKDSPDPRDPGSNDGGDPADEIDRLLERWNGGDPEALSRLMPLIVNDLRRIAHKYFDGERSSNTLQPTELVNELFLRLDGCRTVHWKNPAHFFRSAGRMMRRLLVDHARARKAAKRGGDVVKIPLFDEIPEAFRRDPEILLDLDGALERLRSMDPRQSQIVELRWFVGLKIEEIAHTLEIGTTTVKKELKSAARWLLRELRRR